MLARVERRESEVVLGEHGLSLKDLPR